MSTPPNRQAEKERKPVAKQNQSTTKGQAATLKRSPTSPQAERRAQPAAAKPKAAPQPAAKTVTTPASATAAPQAATPKTATPPAPRPRDPTVARRDERREERRAEIQARQQERRRELQQAKRQKLSIRYSFAVAAVLLVALVSVFSVEHQFLIAILSATAVIIGLLAFLAFATLAPTRKPTSYRTRVTQVGAKPEALPGTAAKALPEPDTTSNSAQEATGQAQEPAQEATDQE